MRQIHFIFVLALTLVFSLRASAQPGNDACASATSLTVNDPCVNGTTVQASLQIGEVAPSCDNTQDQSVWYSFVANATSMDVNIDFTSFPCWPTSAVYDGSSGCVPGGAAELSCLDNVDPQNHSLTGLTVGNTYYVQILYDVGGPCGNSSSGGAEFCIDVDGTPLVAHCTNGIQDADETGVDCGGVDCPACGLGGGSCTDNEECASAENIDGFMSDIGAVQDGDTLQTCGTDCNTGATDESYTFAGGGCSNQTIYQQTWYQFTATNSLLDIEVTSTDFNPVISIWDPCGGIYGCFEYGTGGTVSISQFGLTPGQDYAISVGSDTDGDEGSFDICVTDYDLAELCNLDNTLTITPPATTSSLIPGGTWPPGTTVEFCYTVNQWDNTTAAGCQWIMGIAADWGGCWDPSTYTTTTAPTTNSTDGTWTWETGTVTHNVTAADVNAQGGMFVYDNTEVAGWGDGCPGNYTGLGCNGGCDPTTYGTWTWTYCFELTTWATVADCQANSTDCSVSIKTYADGEIGSYTDGFCADDAPTNSGSQVSCCDLTGPGLEGTYTIDTSAFISATEFVVTLDEPVICGDVDATDFTLATNSWPLGGATITSATPQGCAGGATDTTSTIVFTLSTSPTLGYDDSWYITPSGTNDVKDVCGNVMTAATTGPVVILPIELLMFDGRYNSEVVDLNWQTASEIQSDYFIVEKSVDGVNFSPVIVVQATGNSSSTQSYDAVDRYPAQGTNYYRLQLVDMNGEYRYSNVVTVDVENPKEDLTIIPNPVDQEQFTAEFKYFAYGLGKMYVTDATGRVVREKDFQLVRGRNRVQMNSSGLTPGMYMVIMDIKGDRFQTKMIVK